jgi:enterochelin esterase-like enzyme
MICFHLSAFATDEHIIKSDILGYSIRYWVHVPAGDQQNLPVLYVTDGKWYKDSGGLVEVSQSLIRNNKIQPHIIVMVDAFDPEQSAMNRRNSQFLCNPDYVNFYRNELLPAIDEQYATIKSREGRAILGLSFGGLNSMYFALQANDIFGKIGIQSPAPHPCPDIYTDFEQHDKLPLEIFLSTGTVNDKARATRRLKSILDSKGYAFKYVEVAEGHNWRNWGPLLDDVLIYFYGQ